MNFYNAGLAANIGDLVEWESLVCHLIALIILTVGLYLLLFRPVKRMISASLRLPPNSLESFLITSFDSMLFFVTTILFF